MGECLSKHFTELSPWQSKGAHFTDERITAPDYPSRVIKAVLTNSIITHLEENRREEMEKEEEEEQQSSGFQGSVVRISGIITPSVAREIVFM